ncbi:MAG: T9SS type A sorting domain-containing protein [bacterium]
MTYLLLVIFGSLNFERINIDTQIYPHGIWAADINGDGAKKVDIIGLWSTGAAWYEHTANINTWIAHPIATTSSNFGEISAADFDKDGDNDLIFTVRPSNQIWVCINNGAGSFTTSAITTGFSSPRYCYPADVNNDGNMDFVAGHQTSSATAFWFKNNGSASFTPMPVGTEIFSSAWKVYPFDANADNHFEVLVSGYANNSVFWMQNNGSESFTKILVSGAITYPAGIAAADLDNDGDKDVVVSEAYTGTRLLWYENNGGTFIEHLLQTGLDWDGVDIGDIDLDGDIDIVACNKNDANTGSVRLYENMGGKNFLEQIIDPLVPEADIPYIVEIDDDSCPDIVVSDAVDTNGYFILYHQNCGGAVEEKETPNSFVCKVYPSPVFSSAQFEITVSQQSIAALKIYNTTGSLVYETSKELTNGVNKIPWNTRDMRGKLLNSGAYFYKLELKSYGKTCNCHRTTKTSGKLIVFR